MSIRNVIKNLNEKTWQKIDMLIVLYGKKATKRKKISKKGMSFTKWTFFMKFNYLYYIKIFKNLDY